MKKIELKQQVKLFVDEDRIGTQEVHIDTTDPCGPWINVIHDGHEMPMSLTNWDKLAELVEKAKSKINGKEE